LEDDYLDADSTFLGTVARLASAACYAIDKDLPGVGENDLLGIILNPPHVEYTCSQSIDIHSRGFNRYASGQLVALVIAATVAALIGPSQLESKREVQDAIQTMNFVNSAPSPDPDCTAKVSEATNRILLSLGIDKTWAMCQTVKASRERAGLSSSAHAINSKPRQGHR